MIDFGPELKVVRQKGRVTLTVQKQIRYFTVWVDDFVAALPAEPRAEASFDDFCRQVESGEYDQSNIGKRRRAFTLLESLSSDQIVQFAYEILSVVTEPKQ